MMMIHEDEIADVDADIDAWGRMISMLTFEDKSKDGNVSVE